MDQLKAYEPTWRERAASGLQDMLMSRFGMSAYDAMKMAQKVTGGGQGAVGGMGLLDVTPVGLAFGAQEGGLQAGEGAARAAGGDVGGGLLGMGLGALAVAPIAKPGRAAKPVFDLSNLTDTPKVAQAALTRYTPPRGVPDRIERLQNNKRAFMDPLRLKFVEKLGEAGGNKAFNQYIDLMAATSAGAKTDANARIASYYYVNGASGQPVPIPPIGSGYGHKAQNLHNRNANEILAGGGLDPIEHPKRFTFAENLKGNWEPVTVDKHNIRAWGMASRDPEWVAKRLEDTQAGAPSWWNEKAYGAWDPKTFSPREFVKSNNIKWDKIPATWFEGAPTKTEYQALEQLNQKLSDAMGVLPAPGQAALWLGAGPVTGLGSPPVSMMSTFEQLLQKRAAARGETPEAVLDQFIRRTRPLMVPVGAVGLGGLLAQDPESQ